MDYFDYMCNQPMSDGKEICSFLDEDDDEENEDEEQEVSQRNEEKQAQES